jgi:hypothetical protein
MAEGKPLEKKIISNLIQKYLGDFWAGRGNSNFSSRNGLCGFN